MKHCRKIDLRGFTLVEMLVTIGISALVGVMVFLILNSGMVLYAKNTAVNSAHQQARTGLDQMLVNIHQSVSIPELVDTNLQQTTEVDNNNKPIPAAGISFQTFYAGPYPVVVNANATDSSVVLYCPGYVPTADTRLNIPSYNIELDIASSTMVGNYRQFNFASPLGTAIAISGDGIEGDTGVSYIITAFITTRVSYAVIGSELRYFPTNSLTNYSVIARNVTADSATPFTVPVQSTGQLQNRYVAAVNLSTIWPNYSNLGYAAVNMFISSMIPFRCRLTNTQ